MTIIVDGEILDLQQIKIFLLSTEVFCYWHNTKLLFFMFFLFIVAHIWKIE